MPDRFKHMVSTEANEECRTKGQHTGANCGTCSMRVILHCTICKIQVTACLCSTIDDFGADAAFMRLVEQYGEEQTRDHYRKMGLYVPPSEVPKRLIVPGEG
jgi:hypothetical protein